MQGQERELDVFMRILVMLVELLQENAKATLEEYKINNFCLHELPCTEDSAVTALLYAFAVNRCIARSPFVMQQEAMGCSSCLNQTQWRKNKLLEA